jgi:hypothetical protein
MSAPSYHARPIAIPEITGVSEPALFAVFGLPMQLETGD